MNTEEDRMTPGEEPGLAQTTVLINDRTLDENLPPLPSSPFNRVPLPPECDAGALDCLPIELLHTVIRQLDLHTLFDFRLVNRRASALVLSLPQLRIITKHALNALRGIFCIRTGRWITCEVLYEKLCTERCENCDDFGGYLYLLTCKRVCFLCFTTDNRYLPIRRRHVERSYAILDLQTMASIPSMQPIPGVYSPSGMSASYQTLFDPEAARQAAVVVHGSFRAMTGYSELIWAQERELSVYAQILDPWWPARWPSDAKGENPVRFMAIVRAPWFDRRLGGVEWGAHCVGCAEARNFPLHFRRKFTAASFRGHLQECGPLRHGKHVNPADAQTPPS